MLPWISKPKKSVIAEKKSVCALLLSKDQWKYLGKKEKKHVQTS
jgi:hypothetical protein